MPPFHSQSELSNAVKASFLQEKIREHPEVIENYLVLAEIKMNEGKLVEAKNLWKKVYVRAPEDPRIVAGLAESYMADGEYNEALALMRLAGERGVRSQKIYKDMAKAYYLTGKFKLVDYYLEKALQLDSKDWELYYIKGATAGIREDTVAAYQNLEKAYELHPSDTVFNKMFDYAMARGNMKRCGKYISKKFIKHSGSPDLLYRAGNYFRQKGEVDTTYYLYQQLMIMEPGRVRGYNGLANSFYEQAKYDSALYYVDHALALDSTIVSLHLTRARVLGRKYHYNDARQEYLHVLQMDTANVIAQNELKKLNRKVAYLRSLKKYEKRKEEVQMIIPLKPKVLN